MLESPQREYAELTAACLELDPHARVDFTAIVWQLEKLFEAAASELGGSGT